MTTEIAVQGGGSGLPLAIRAEQNRFDAAQLAGLAQLGVQDAPQGDLDVFFHRCRITGLDPFAKQIYMIGRNTKITEWVSGRRVDRWEVKYTIQTAIDGYRVTGNRLADERADEIDQDETLWCGTDGRWVDIWLDPEHPPAAAKYVIRKNGKPYVAKVMYSEYVQTNTDGTPNSTWKKRPAGQLGKCAEALAWRMAYPQDFSGVELDAAVNIEPDGSPSPVRATTERVSAAEALAGAVANTTPPPVLEWKAPDGALPSDPVAKPEAPQANESDNSAPDRESLCSRPQQERLRDLLDAAGVTGKADKHSYLSNQFQRKITGANQLTATEAEQLIEYLEAPIEPDSVAEATDERAIAAADIVHAEFDQADTEGGDQ